MMALTIWFSLGSLSNNILSRPHISIKSSFGQRLYRTRHQPLGGGSNWQHALGMGSTQTPFPPIYFAIFAQARIIPTVRRRRSSISVVNIPDL